jgi:uncharacterized membrane protein
LNDYGPFAFHHGPGPFGWTVLALFCALVVLGVVAVVYVWRGVKTSPFTAGGTRPGPGSDPAIGELRMRYARGEISWEDYAQRAFNLGFPVTPGARPEPPGTGTSTPPLPAPPESSPPGPQGQT